MIRETPRRHVPLALLSAACVLFATRSGLAQSEPDGGAPAEAAAPTSPVDSSPEAVEPAPPSPVEAPPPKPEPPASPSQVTVRGRHAEARRLQQSAESVTVVEMQRAGKESADLGEVLARTQGVAIRRTGGLGSYARFSMNGLYDDQIRFFIDGVPLDQAGFPFGIANVPVNFVERVELYRGVVPIRFGADALGGAVNLVTSHVYDNGAQASYQVGSFGTQRITLGLRGRHDASGFVANAGGFLDWAKNNYPVDVQLTDERGRLSDATVRRFHDGYAARGGHVEVGFVDKPWAKRLLLKGFATSYEKELQHNIVMSVPYGEPTYGEAVYGATLRYEQPFFRNLELESIVNYSFRAIEFVDNSKWVYDWLGQRVNDRRLGGEIEADKPKDQRIWEHNLFARANLAWTVAPSHVIRASATPRFTTRTGDERIEVAPNQRDPLTAKRDLFALVSGLEYQIDLLPMTGSPDVDVRDDSRLQNIVFVKDYVYSVSSEEAQAAGGFQPKSRDSHDIGAGDAVRFRFTRWLLAKASYEYATRLPRADEIFGDGKLVLANLDLEPEVSHNANIGPRVEVRRTKLGDFSVDVNAFFRDSDRLIFPLNNDRYITYQNVYRARMLGIEGAVAWSSPGRWLTLDGTMTALDNRNVSDEGAFGAFDGDRIPNRPWLFASWRAQLRFPHLLTSTDELEPFYVGRYVHSFYRGWESQGRKDLKQVIDAQLTHGVGVSYSLRNEFSRITSTFEIQNVTDARVYDFVGVQRPGRAFFIKLTAEL